MGSDESKMTSKELLNEQTMAYYMDLIDAPDQGRKVAWASSIFPQEFLEVMDVAVAYPENHCAAISAKGGAMQYIDRAEALGYAGDICSYARINLGYADIMESDIVDLPRPDFVVCVNNICNCLIKWYESLATFYDVPFFMIDVPFNYDVGISQDRIDYIKDQFEDFIVFLEEQCGKPFDREKFQQVMETSNRVAKAWRRAMDFASQIPSPLDGFNMFNYMSMMVCLRGKEQSVELYDLIAEEMEQLVKEGGSQFKGEQNFRVMWDGIACWPYLRHNYSTMRDRGVIISGSTYPSAWTLVYEPGNMDQLAEVYAGIGNNRSMAEQVDGRVEIQAECQCDGVIYHMNRSCKIMDFMQIEMRRQINEKNGVPYAAFDGDQSDPKNFSKAQFETRIDALIENMREAKAAKEGK